ncbi:MAG: citrate/2-methylcitrate synthase [Ruminococcus sp.]|nr:citrate/2-methylcitrate synthase [Ruminococcus sp.]
MPKSRMQEFFNEKAVLCEKNDTIPNILFQEYGVNRGLRDQSGKGVLTGLTRISDIISYRQVGGVRESCAGELWYRGYPIKSLIAQRNSVFGFEKTAYLLLFGEMPSEQELQEFCRILGQFRTLPANFVRDVIMKAPTKDIMNSMTKSILTLASYDSTVGDDSLMASIQQCFRLIATFPLLATYGYHAYNHYENYDSMYIHQPDPEKSTAENFLALLRPDGKYTALEADVLDVALMLHMEHGGGNNSTFTTRVVTSSGSDTYSTIAAAMSSLKGAKHGGANIKVMQMMQNIRENVSDWLDRDAVRAYLDQILEKQVFDKKGLIYGIGHAVYSISDPREQVLKSYVEELAVEKGKETELQLYRYVEELAPELIAKKRHIFKGVSPNVDFYSGFVYDMLGIPVELYTPLFAIARVVGWCAHRLEELINAGKIVRPSYKSVMTKAQEHE